MVNLMEKTTMQENHHRSVYDESMLREMGYMNTQIGQGNAIMQQGFHEIQQSIGQVKRKQRKSLVNTSIALKQNGEIALAEVYDDGTQNLQPLVLNVHGKWHVYRVKFRYIDSQREYFAIHFSESGYWIFGDIAKNTEGGLYAYFIRGNIKFASNVSKSKIKRALFEKFGPEIDLCRDTFTFPELAGWNGEHFVTAENFAFPVTKDFPPLPVRRKSFLYFIAQDGRFVRYVQALNCINNVDLRAILSVFPLAALIATIFVEKDFRIPVMINFITVDGALLKIIGGFFQIFNRQELKFISLDTCFTNLARVIAEAKDEVVSFSAPYYMTMEGYRKRKVAENLERIISSYFHPSSAINGTESPAHAIAFVSDRLIKDKNVLNIFIEKDMVENFEKIGIALSGKTMPEVFSAFVSFAENNLFWIRSLIRAEKEGRDSKQAFGRILRRIMVKFGEFVEFDFLKELSIDQVDFDRLFMGDQVSGDDLSELLTNAVRKEIVHFIAQNKKTADVLRPTYIYYNTETVWISPQILEIMLSKQGLLPEKTRLIHEAREKRMLITDSEGYTRKMQIGGKRVEMYQFHRNALNIPGGAEIIDLTKGDSEC